MRRAIDQLRLLLAEKLISWAVTVAPKDHPDSLAIIEAAQYVCQREITEN